MLPDRKRVEIVRQVQTAIEQLEHIVNVAAGDAWTQADVGRLSLLKQRVHALTERVHYEVITEPLRRRKEGTPS